MTYRSSGATYYYSSDPISVLVKILMGWLVAIIVIGIILMISRWKIFKKAGKPGWESIIPFFSFAMMLDIVGYNPLLAIPYFLSGTVLNMLGDNLKIIQLIISLGILIFSIMVLVRLAKAFGHSGVFAVGLIFLSPIFFPILAFSKGSVYNPSFAYTKGGNANNGMGDNFNIGTPNDMNVSNENNVNQNVNNVIQDNSQNILQSTAVPNTNVAAQDINTTPQEPVKDLSSYGTVQNQNTETQQNVSSTPQKEPIKDLSSYGTQQNNNTESSNTTEDKVNPDELW